MAQLTSINDHKLTSPHKNTPKLDGDKSITVESPDVDVVMKIAEENCPKYTLSSHKVSPKWTLVFFLSLFFSLIISPNLQLESKQWQHSPLTFLKHQFIKPHKMVWPYCLHTNSKPKQERGYMVGLMFGPNLKPNGSTLVRTEVGTLKNSPLSTFVEGFTILEPAELYQRSRFRLKLEHISHFEFSFGQNRSRIPPKPSPFQISGSFG